MVQAKGRWVVYDMYAKSIEALVLKSRRRLGGWRWRQRVEWVGGTGSARGHSSGS